jgi:Flp pilus assembly protein TadG
VNSGVALLRRDSAQSLAESAVIIPLLCLLLFGLIDFGRAYYLSIEISNAAYAGALYGSVNSTDTTGMQSAATTDAVDVSNMTATATYGCECSNGSNPSPSCTSTPSCPSNTSVVNYVTVTTSATYKPIVPWPGIPSPLTLAGTATLRATD